ncbi:hypothetical protein M0812_16343 [Anaeramoeba flamelloides]|uniref:Uncharacterized protein n=1 Tax=Anaeramoeba flamelloides TaxID=1746091 RepID=A0AAV7ZGR6_9EUKA|nr:hypothetical protein M0812_16343 [Anaeramoeba flamelloides]
MKFSLFLLFVGLIFVFGNSYDLKTKLSGGWSLDVTKTILQEDGNKITKHLEFGSLDFSQDEQESFLFGEYRTINENESESSEETETETEKELQNNQEVQLPPPKFSFKLETGDSKSGVCTITDTNGELDEQISFSFETQDRILAASSRWTGYSKQELSGLVQMLIISDNSFIATIIDGEVSYVITAKKVDTTHGLLKRWFPLIFCSLMFLPKLLKKKKKKSPIKIEKKPKKKILFKKREPLIRRRKPEELNELKNSIVEISDSEPDEVISVNESGEVTIESEKSENKK